MNKFELNWKFIPSVIIEEIIKYLYYKDVLNFIYCNKFIYSISYSNIYYLYPLYFNVSHYTKIEFSFKDIFKCKININILEFLSNKCYNLKYINLYDILPYNEDEQPEKDVTFIIKCLSKFKHI